MSMLQPHELNILDKNDLFAYQELLKMPEHELSRLARNYAENCTSPPFSHPLSHAIGFLLQFQRAANPPVQNINSGTNLDFILLDYYMDKLARCKGLQQMLVHKHQQGSLVLHDSFDDLSDPALCQELDKKNLADNKTLLALGPLPKLESICESAKSIFADLPKLEDKIWKLEKGAELREWRKVEEERGERATETREMMLEEMEMFGEEEKRGWWGED
ncbi:MAG: hypothetical protein HETSPECPRED_005812 [Heterodermia speciosa]|uniref:Uncharacterized protein n=1 Tax=Heterodermia speciosa TaxID=116794 RepID=A0A8H3FKE3_9LECA|nr:MAG: hypothetical protein HETSPECPRED_005812 [Heterodermia speciosa]